LKANIELYNEILAEFVSALKSRHKDLDVLTFDSYTWFNQILDDAAFYGFTNTTG
jgi:phospholipase/lecithinase/hemolysin